ncbi:tail fiber domain-containing protein, partial [Candidatus Nomurabacteria bacterium]|nr:tail fiber domain-containing protein [Candidatus Nomurabacteria bacterium]
NNTNNNTALGYNTGRGIVTGINNTILGANVTGLPATLSNNIIIADGQGNQRINVGSTGNVGIGTTNPGYSLDVAGNTNISSGSAYKYNSINMAYAITAQNAYFLGGAGNLTTTGTRLTATGYHALFSNTSGVDNTANGTFALENNTDGNQNTAYGVSALRTNVSGSYNTGVGFYSLFANTTGTGNTGFGFAALAGNTTGYHNTAVGQSALTDLDITADDGSGNNTAIGYNTARGIVTGINNTILGANVTGLPADLSNTVIVATGAGDRFSHNFALAGTSGYNTFLGLNAGNFTMTGSTGSQGSYNTGIGVNVLTSNTTGFNNTGIGFEALKMNTTGNYNAALGLQALSSNTTGSDNIGIGYAALYDLDITADDGSGNNIAIGHNTGRGIITGVNNTILGANVNGLPATLSNNIIIADGQGNQRINVDGNGYVGIGTTEPSSKMQVGLKVVDDNGFAYDADSLMVIHQTPTAAATLNDPKNVLMLARQGTASESYGAAAAFNLSRFENSGTDSKTRLDISLANTDFDVLNNNIMTLLSNGNVGIGTTKPSGTLSFDGTDKRSIFIERNTTAATEGKDLSISAGGSTVGTTDKDGGSLLLLSGISTGTGISSIRFFTTTAGSTGTSDNIQTEKMTILGNGNVGIGTTDPGYLLHVGSTSVTDATVLLRLEDADSTCDFTANAGAPTCGSDETLKKNINTQSDNLAKVLALRPVTYNWLTDQDGVEVKHGFIAQEVAKVMPELVTDGTWIDGTTRKFLQTAGMTPYMVGAIQELNANLESLTLPTTTENITQTFAERFFGKLATWLADTGNGIGSIFAETYTAKEKLCINNTCVTEEQLQVLLQNANVSPASVIIPEPNPTPAPEPTPTSDPTPTPASTPSTDLGQESLPQADPVISPDPTPSPEPTPTPENPEIPPTPETPTQ